MLPRRRVGCSEAASTCSRELLAHCSSCLATTLLSLQILGDAYGCVLVDHLLQRRPRGGGSGGTGGSKQIPYIALEPIQLEMGEAHPQPQGQQR